MADIEFGDIVQDNITGFKGVVTGRTESINICDRITVQPQGLDKEGKVHDSMEFDVTSLTKIGHLEGHKTVKPKKQDIGLKDMVRSVITGFEGVATRRTIWSNGCVYYSVQPLAKEEGSALPKAIGFFDNELEVTKKYEKPVEKRTTGGPPSAGQRLI